MTEPRPRNTMAHLTAMLLVVLSTPLAGQETHTISYGTPADVGMSAAGLAEALSVYEDAVESGELVGAVVLVAREGRIVLHEALGWKDKERRLPMERNTLFRMASNTKPVIATGIAHLVEKNRLAYDDAVGAHIPAWDNDRSGAITIGQLLSHSSGLRIESLFVRPLMEPSTEHPDAPTLQLEAARFGAIGPEVAPGESYSYSNPGFNTLAALAEIASGKLLEDYLSDLLYTPLGMVDSYNHRAGHTVDGKLDRMGAVYYERDAAGAWIPGGTPGGQVAYPFARGSGGMISTAADYAIFCQMFLNGGIYEGVRYLRPETVALMTSPKLLIDGEGDDARSYGYGWSVANGVYGHSGSDGTAAWIDPERQIIGLVFTQTPRGENPLARFQELVGLAVRR